MKGARVQNQLFLPDQRRWVAACWAAPAGVASGLPTITCRRAIAGAVRLLILRLVGLLILQAGQYRRNSGWRSQCRLYLAAQLRRWRRSILHRFIRQRRRHRRLRPTGAGHRHGSSSRQFFWEVVCILPQETIVTQCFISTDSTFASGREPYGPMKHVAYAARMLVRCPSHECTTF